jgi:hypothetical protein
MSGQAALMETMMLKITMEAEVAPVASIDLKHQSQEIVVDKQQEVGVKRQKQ